MQAIRTNEQTPLQGEPPGEYRGRCMPCGRDHVFVNDVPLAMAELEALFRSLASDPVRAALDESKGKMLGVLVAEDAHGGRRVLRAHSGELAGRRDWPGWAPSVLRREDTAVLEAETLLRIETLNHQIETCDVAGAQRRLDETRHAVRAEAAARKEARRRDPSLPSGQALVEEARRALLAERARLHALRIERRDASLRLSTAMFDAAGVTNARGLRRPLREVFAGDAIAGGTADCAVPKLLEAANVAGWRPVAIAEAWWGPPIGERRHGDVQPPCERKCLPILGFLLCDR